MSAIAVCTSEYLAAEDIPADKKVGIKICGIEAVPQTPGMPKKGGKNRKNREVLLVRGPGKKSMVLNPTNQWSIALLLGSKDWRQWIGKRVEIWTDIDVDIETQQQCRCLRVAGSPDASPERQEAYDKAWRSGRRQRGELVRRVKRAFRLLCGSAIPAAEETRPDDLPPELPDEPDSEPPAPPEKETGDFETEGAESETKAPERETPAPERMREPGEDLEAIEDATPELLGFEVRRIARTVEI